MVPSMYDSDGIFIGGHPLILRIGSAFLHSKLYSYSDLQNRTSHPLLPLAWKQGIDHSIVGSLIQPGWT